MPCPSTSATALNTASTGEGHLRSTFSEESFVQPRHKTSHSLITTFPTAMLPSYLKRLDLTGDSITQLTQPTKPPLLTLNLSTASFLDASLTAEEETDQLYSIHTRGTTTTICRTDPWDGVTQTAAVKWPADLNSRGKSRELDIGVLVQTNEQEGWLPSTHILRPGSRSNSPRKFHIPGYSRAMKWKLAGNSYWCMSPSVKGPVAAFEQASGSKLARLHVYETLYSKNEVRPMLVHREVSLALLDALVCTSLLLVTDPYEWMLVGRHDENGSPTSPLGSLDLAVRRDVPSSSVSAQQLRKIMYGEPLFPRRTGSLPVRCNSMYQSTSSLPSHTSSPISTLDSEDEDDVESAGVSEMLPAVSTLSIQALLPSGLPSPSAESSVVPNMLSEGAPPHTHLDPTFYSEMEMDRASRQQLRLLPQPPRSPTRSQSIPPREPQRQTSRHRSDTTSSLPHQDQTLTEEVSPASHPTSASALTSIRRLPVPPPAVSSSAAPVTASSPTTRTNKRHSKTYRSLPPTPQHPHQKDMPWGGFTGMDPPPAYNTINFHQSQSYGAAFSAELMHAPQPVAASTSSSTSTS